MISSLRSALEMRKSSHSVTMALTAALLCTALTVPVEAFVPNETPVNAKVFRHPGLHIPSLEKAVSDLPLAGGPDVLELASLGVAADQGLYDWRAGRWGSLVLSRPLIPGTGVGNSLRANGPVGEAEVWRALSDFLRLHQQELRVDLAEIPAPSVGIFENGNIVNVSGPRVVGGMPVRGSRVAALINHGNLILLALEKWGNVDTSVSPKLTAAAAEAVVTAHLSPFAVSGFREDAHLELVPLARGTDFSAVPAGAGYDYRLVWVLAPDVKDDMGTWEALVDAVSGELIEFEDRNAYVARKVKGGAYPVSNDQRPPDGLEQAGTPMPFANVTPGGFTTTGGMVNQCVVGSMTTTLNGQFIRMNDICGGINETAPGGDLDLGFGPTDLATDCTVPPGHSVGDTKASRTGMYELNRIKEQAKGYLTFAPPLTWLNAVLQSNMNINNQCNAFWNGTTVNFYRDNGSSCRNTGEIAAVFDHEWGHGMDDNGTHGPISQPQEGVADAYSTLRLRSSCVGRGFRKNAVCGGYGDPCVGTPATGCTGVRDADFAQHVSGLPHGITWILSNCTGAGSGPCGRQVHCEGQAFSEVAWDLHFRDLAGPPYNFDANTALEVATRIYYLAADNIAAYYTCAVGGGCNAGQGYLTFLGIDDDNGNINDGTPHMTAIRGAFERHQIHCATPAVQDTGCATGPTTAPVVVATPTAGGVDLSWGAVPGAATYAVYRAEGVLGCDFGKIKIGTTAATNFSDTGLQDGRTYLYGVLPIGASSPSCLGRMSACASAVPTAVADPCVIQGNTSFVSAASSVDEPAGPAVIPVQLTTGNGQPSTGPASVNFATADGTATAGQDYTATSGALVFPTGTPSGTTMNITVPIINDIDVEPNETFTVTLSQPNGATLGAITVHTVTIISEDVPVELQGFSVE